MKKVVVIGGGTGTFVVLSGIKDFNCDISAVVSIMDSGGSTGKLRDQYGVVPPGDIRQCLVALSDASDLWRKLFLYRFEKGDFIGHNFGNIFLTALEQIEPNYQKVIDTASYILQTKGDVIPVTFDKVQLCAEYEDGEIIETEELIDTAFHKKTRINNAFLKPTAKANERALKALSEADVIILGPGDLYTSIIPNLVVEGIADAIKDSSAKIINIMNLMTKQGQTTDYKASNHLEDLKHYIHRKIDTVIINAESVSDEVESYYESYGEHVVEDDLDDNPELYGNIIRADILAHQVFHGSDADQVARSLQRHDSQKVATILKEIIES